MVLTDMQKYEIIFRRDINGESMRFISKEMKINRKTVSSVLERYDNGDGIGRKIGSGRPKKFTTEQIGNVISEFKKNKTRSAKEIKTCLDIAISIRSVQNILNDHNIRYIYPKTRPLLTMDHKRKRLEWARKHVSTDWNNVIFSDESSVCIGSCGRKRWVDCNDNADYENIVKFPAKVHIWGCIHRKFTRCHVFHGIMNSDVYVNILNEHLLPIYDETLTYQHDNDPKHTSKYTKGWLSDNAITVLDWPSSSPDLNPIENIWEIIKHKISKMAIQSKSELTTIVEQQFKLVDDSSIQGVIRSMKNRIQLVIEKEGDYIGY